MMTTSISKVIEALTLIKEAHGDIHVRIMGEPIAGISVRKIRTFCGDHFDTRHEANIVGRAFDGTLAHLAEEYQRLTPIAEVQKLEKENPL